MLGHNVIITLRIIMALIFLCVLEPRTLLNRVSSFQLCVRLFFFLLYLASLLLSLSFFHLPIIIAIITINSKTKIIIINNVNNKIIIILINITDTIIIIINIITTITITIFKTITVITIVMMITKINLLLLANLNVTGKTRVKAYTT